MNERVRLIYESIIINKILVASVVRRINVDEVDPASVGLFQQPQRRQIVPLQQEVHLAAVVD